LTQSYEPFGSILSNQGDLSISYGFDGEWADATRLTHLRARYYDPSKGRFLTKDPLQGFLSVPQTLNLYSYTRNNPVNRNDPSGYIDDNPQDSRIVGLIITGIILTSAIVTSEVLLTWAETEMIPVIVAQPYVGVPMEAILLTLSVVLIDIDVAYWSYVYRVYQNPNESQCFIWLPPWGLDE